MDDFDFECNHCGCGYNHGEGRFSIALDAWVCDPCFDEINDQK